MTRRPRFYLVFVVSVALALALVQYAGASPFAAPQAVHRAQDGFFVAALQWLVDLIGLPNSTSGKAPGLEAPAQKGGKLPAPTGTSCIDPVGTPPPPLPSWCIEVGL